MNKAIFLDRDGTFIIDKHYLNDPDGVEFLPGAIDALKQMVIQGYILIVVTNQSGVFRGLVDEEQLNQIHKRIDQELHQHGIKITQYYVSPHGPDSNHPWRKPNPGMILQGIKDYELDPKSCWMIGDKVSDAEAGVSSGMPSILLTHPPSGAPTVYDQCKDLSEALSLILKKLPST